VAIFKHRDIESVMPPEVRRRANGGVGKGKVDWYAGRRYQPNLSPGLESEPDPTDLTGAPIDVIDEMHEARREIKRASSTARRAQASNLVRAAAGRTQRILAPVSQRLHRYFSNTRTDHI
jgi:hypothetical protein